jgi:hypothetical protein
MSRWIMKVDSLARKLLVCLSTVPASRPWQWACHWQPIFLDPRRVASIKCLYKPCLCRACSGCWHRFHWLMERKKLPKDDSGVIMQTLCAWFGFNICVHQCNRGPISTTIQIFVLMNANFATYSWCEMAHAKRVAPFPQHFQNSTLRHT